MVDIEKVIKNIESYLSSIQYEREMPAKSILFDALKLLKEQKEEIENLKQTAQSMMESVCLLKEQEPVLLENQHKPYGISTNANSPWISRCPRCGKKVEGKQTRFCKYCGQAVKWNDKC